MTTAHDDISQADSADDLALTGSDTDSDAMDTSIPSTWLELRVVAPLDTQEAVSAFLWEVGAQGITEEAAARAGEPWVLLRAYVEQEDAESLKQSVKEHLLSLDEFFPGASLGRVSVSVVEQKDWNAAWMEHFKPFRISPRLVIRPVWEAYSPLEHDVVIDLDPGMAFGTGAHESTRGCLMAIDALMGGGGVDVAPIHTAANPLRSVLDVGTGSGILLIAALKLGGLEGEGVDLDPLAVDSATNNTALNRLSSRVKISDTLLQHTVGTHPLVLANILAPTLIELSPHLVSRVEPGGALVLSGLLHEQAPGVLSAFLPLGMRQEAALQEGEWCTLVLRRPASL